MAALQVGERAAVRPRRGGPRRDGRARGWRTCSTVSDPGARAGARRVRAVDRAVAARPARAGAAGRVRGALGALARLLPRRRARRAPRAGEFAPVAAPDEVADRLVALVDGLGFETALGYRWTSPERMRARAGGLRRPSSSGVRIALARGHASRYGERSRPAVACERAARRPRGGGVARRARRRAASSACPASTRSSIWEALRGGPLRTLGFRTELCAGFAADGYARAERAAGAAAALDRPGRAQLAHRADGGGDARTCPWSRSRARSRARCSAAGAASCTSCPTSAPSSPRWSSARARAESAEGLPELLAAAWREALTPPTGPVYVEIPVDVLEARRRACRCPTPRRRAAAARARRGRRRVAGPPRLLAGAERARCCGPAAAWSARARGTELRGAGRAAGRARRHDVHGQGRVPGRSSARASARAATRRRSRSCSPSADVVLAVGTELGAETTGQYGLDLRRAADPPRRRARADRRDLPGARPRRRRARDARRAARRRARRASATAPAPPRGRRARAHRPRPRRAGPRRSSAGCWPTSPPPPAADAVIGWDMTILAYWAAAHFPQQRRRGFLYPLGSGTLGYAFPAALGAQAALPGERDARGGRRRRHPLRAAGAGHARASTGCRPRW